MTAPTVTAYGLPTGGVISLQISGAVSGAALLQRAASGLAFSTIYSGVPLELYIDTGEPLPAPLDANTPYQYQYTDNLGTTTTPFITPSCYLSVQPEPITQLLIRIIQGMLNSIALPTGINRAQVTQAMPLGGNIPLPLVVINLDLMQQGPIPIGQSTLALCTTVAISGFAGAATSITGLARRVFRVSVLTDDAPAREFYRDSLVGLFEAIYQSVLQPIGIDTSHKWQVSSGQVAKDRFGKAPGFYFADVIMEFEGTLNITINPPIGYIETIQTTLSSYDIGASGQIILTGESDIVTVPVSG